MKNRFLSFSWLLLAAALLLTITARAQVVNITQSVPGLAYNANATQVTSTSYLVRDRDHTVLVDAATAGGNVTVSLPPLSTKKYPFVVIKKIDSGTNTVTIDADGSQTIDGAGTLVLRNQHQDVILHSDGNQWRWLNRPTQGGIQALTAGTTVTWAPDATSSGATLTPAQSETINVTVTGAVKGQLYVLKITTSGTSSYTLTFSTNFKTTGTLATGTSSAKVFVMLFYFDGSTLNEVSRTTAM